MPEHTSGGTSKDQTAALLTAAAVGAAITAAAIVGAWAIGILAAGDEAPIRVKNNSIDAEIVHKGTKWKEDGDRKKWKLTSGTRGGNDYDVFIAPKDAANCPDGVRFLGKTVRFTSSDNTSVEFKATGNHTRVTADKDLALSADEKTLSYSAAGAYISQILVDTKTVCTFAAKDATLGVVLLDK